VSWNGDLHVVELRVPCADAGVLAELLCAVGIPCATWEQPTDPQAVLRVFCDDPGSAAALQEEIGGRLEGWLSLLSQRPAVSRQVTQREDWAEVWKKHFPTFRASRRIVVKPSWEDVRTKPGDVVLEIDPGMTFGTGHHATTQACLSFIDELSEELGNVAFLDAGCGSGILSMAAAKLGFQPLAAFDHDPDAVRVARENLRRAGVDDVVLTCADVATFSPQRRFRVVVANILADVLARHAECLAGYVDTAVRPSYLVLAGILDEQYAGIRVRYEALGLRESAVMRADGWTSARLAVCSPAF